MDVKNSKTEMKEFLDLTTHQRNSREEEETFHSILGTKAKSCGFQPRTHVYTRNKKSGLSREGRIDGGSDQLMLSSNPKVGVTSINSTGPKIDHHLHDKKMGSSDPLL